jgi:hypothetical protein
MLFRNSTQKADIGLNKTDFCFVYYKFLACLGIKYYENICTFYLVMFY